MAEQLDTPSTPVEEMLPFLNAMPDGMVVSDSGGRIVLVNSVLEALSGFSCEELMGLPVETLVPERYRTRHATDRHEYFASGHPSRAMGAGLDLSLTRKDGREVPVDVALSSVQLADTRFIVAAVRDATQRRRVEVAIRESEHRWRTLLENVRLLVVGLDRRGRITYANPHLRQVCGYTDDDLIGQDWFSLCLPDDATQEVGEIFGDLIGGGSAGHYVNAIKTKGAGRRIIAWYNTVLTDEEGTAAGTLSIGQDITDQRHAEELLKAVNEVAQAILENRPVEEALHVIAARSRLLVGGSVASVVTPAQSDGQLVVRVADGERAADIEGLHFPADRSISGHVMRSRVTLSLDDVSADPRVNQPVVRIASVGPAIFAPLAAAGAAAGDQDRVFGTLLVGRPGGTQPFTEDERTVIELFASQAAIALEHARFQEELALLAVFDDRERIGRELHDGAIQALFATGMKLQSVLGSLDGDAARRVERAVDDIDQVIGDLRGYIFGLRPGIVRQREVSSALHQLGRELEDTTGVITVVEVDATVATVIEPTGDLIQLVREALSNVGRHAQASTCRIFVGRIADALVVEVDDDGAGFRLEERLGSGQGLPNLHDRAAALGATLEIDSSPVKGTTVRATIPA